MMLTLHNTACNQESINFPLSGAMQLQEVMCMVTVAIQELCVCVSLIHNMLRHTYNIITYVCLNTNRLPTSDILGWHILLSFE